MQLEVTDGWYSVSASIDGPLRHYLASGVLRTGQPCPLGVLLADNQIHAIFRWTTAPRCHCAVGTRLDGVVLCRHEAESVRG